MRICILGWYGTETLGDRAILDGIIKIFRSYKKELQFVIGSLYPFYTERTIYEDSNLFGKDISIFDEKSLSDMKRNIKSSDIVLMGGGPLMDLGEMYLIEKGFTFARRYYKPTLLCGCGLGPIYQDEYMLVAKQILELTDLAIFRDKNSEEKARRLCGSTKCIYLPDPAIVSVLEYKKNHTLVRNEDVAVNFRMFPKGFYGDSEFDVSDAAGIVEALANKYETVKLVPMHTFYVGGDDRVFLNEIQKKVHKSNVELINTPQSLYATYRIFAEAKACVGMRYHSVVMQTILNGNNYIIDYTANKKGGKIASFIEETDAEGFYDNRRVDINQIKDANVNMDILCENHHFEYSLKSNFIEDYVKNINTLI